MNEKLIKLLNYIEGRYSQSQTKYELKYFKENESIEIYFKSVYKEEQCKDFLQVNDHGIHYWNAYKEEYTTMKDMAQTYFLLEAVFI